MIAKEEVNEDNLNRLIIAIITKNKCSYEAAQDILYNLKLNLIVNSEIANSASLQAALLTAVNTAKRTFYGGVFISIPKDVVCKLTVGKDRKLFEVLQDMDVIISDDLPIANFTLTFGFNCNSEDTLEVICNAWQGGVKVNSGDKIHLKKNESMTLGGILAGGLAVGMAFIKSVGIDITITDESCGISLWRPDLDWLSQAAEGPEINILPKKYWILGLGHLGQAYLWSIGLMGYKDVKPEILLQDFDKVTIANFTAGLLCEDESVGIYKTRMCSQWLETLGFKTMITERAFDIDTKRKGKEPYLALCGFDNAKSRSTLHKSDFDLVIESGIGNTIDGFDRIFLHTFPNSFKTPEEIWGNISEEIDTNKAVEDAFNDKTKECGILALNLAKKSISASFIGAIASAFVLSEAVRGLHSGMRFDFISIQLRNCGKIKATLLKQYATELSKNGFINC